MLDGIHLFIGGMFFLNIILVFALNRFYLPDVIISSVCWFKGIDAGADKLAILSIAGVFCSIVCFFIRSRKDTNLPTLIRNAGDIALDKVELHILTGPLPRKKESYFCTVRGRTIVKGEHMARISTKLSKAEASVVKEIRSGPLKAFY